MEVIGSGSAATKSAQVAGGNAPAMQALPTLVTSTPDHDKSLKEREMEDYGHAFKPSRVPEGKAPASKAPAMQMQAQSTLVESTPERFKEPGVEDEDHEDGRAAKYARVACGKAPAMQAEPTIVASTPELFKEPEVLEGDGRGAKSARVVGAKAPMRAQSTIDTSTPDLARSHNEPVVEHDGRAAKCARVAGGKAPAPVRAPAMRALSTLATSTPELFEEPVAVDDGRGARSARAAGGKVPAMRTAAETADSWYLRKRKSVCRGYGIEADAGNLCCPSIKPWVGIMTLLGTDMPKSVKIIVEMASMFTTESAPTDDTDPRAMSYKRFHRKGSQRGNVTAKACKVSLVRSFISRKCRLSRFLCAQVDFDPSSGRADKIDRQLGYATSMRKLKTDRAAEVEQRNKDSADAEKLFAFPGSDSKSKGKARPSSSSSRPAPKRAAAAKKAKIGDSEEDEPADGDYY
jgi:hypothetical protein